MPCLCGADDCYRCHPENFRGKVYIGDLTSEEADAAVEAADEAAIARYEAQRDARESEY